MYRIASFCLTMSLAFFGCAGHGFAADSDRFELSSLKAVRPTLVNTISALQKHDIVAAKDAFNTYDSGWNGVEVYVSTRDKDMYAALEHNYQAKITTALNTPNADTATILPDAQAMLAKYDEMLANVAKAAPLNPLYDDVARLRIVRSHLREVNPALKAGNMAKAKDSFQAFNDNWDSIEDLVKERSNDAYVAIESGMIKVEQALMPDKPDVAQVTTLVNAISDQYNGIVNQVAKEARGPS